MRSANGTVITRPPKLSFLVHNAFDGDNPNFTFISVWWKSVSPSVAATGDTTTGVHHEVRLSLFKRAWRVKNTANMADVCGVTRHAETSDDDGAHNGGSSKVPHLYEGVMLGPCMTICYAVTGHQVCVHQYTLYINPWFYIHHGHGTESVQGYLIDSTLTGLQVCVWSLMGTTEYVYRLDALLELDHM